MMTKTDALARSLTRRNSLSTYLIILVLADRKLVGQCYRAYAYFRWLDDEVDVNIESLQKRQDFIKKQRKIIDSAYKGKKIKNLSPEEKMITQLIFSDDHINRRLESFIRNFFAIIEFDVKRKGRKISSKELEWYSETLGHATTDCMQYFIGYKFNYPDSRFKYSGAIAAHIIHMLRDYDEDQKLGYYNFNLNSKFVKNRIKLARRYFKESREYIRRLPSFRLRVACYVYLFRFERSLRVLERKYV